ncbi:MAG: carboxypeptidase regulatory-like domain-containing protein, partial [Bryobacteraceae bacterium]
SGFPLPVNQTNLNSALGTGNQRPNLVSGVPLAAGGSVEDHVAQVNGGGNPYINANAFTQAPAYTYGDTPRTLDGLRGPGQANTDLSIFKSFTFFERFNAQFRAEAFNLTNTPYFSFPLGTSGTRLGSPNFGLLTTQRNFPRVIQLGIRLSF